MRLQSQDLCLQRLQVIAQGKGGYIGIQCARFCGHFGLVPTARYAISRGTSGFRELRAEGHRLPDLPDAPSLKLRERFHIITQVLIFEAVFTLI